MPEIWTIHGPAFAAGLLAGLLVFFVPFYGLWRRAARLEAEKEASTMALQQAQTDQQLAKHAALQHAETIQKLEDEIANARDRLSSVTADLAARSATMDERARAVLKERESLTALRGELEEKFRTLAHETFKASQKSFLELADEAFKRHKNSADSDLVQRQEAIAGLLKPVQETLKRYEANLGAIEKARNEAYGTLSNELKVVMQAQEGVRAETARLVTALRSQPKTRGRWGEQQLQTVMELAGMSQHVDFVTQSGFIDDQDRRMIPDAILRLPGGRTIVVDAKTSLSAYFDAMDADDDSLREGFLVKHAREIRTHMKQLGARAYWQSLEHTPDFVCMFIPGENFFAAAIERDPELFEDAVAKQVLIVTPTTLIALAKAVAYGWRQEAIAENARHVAELGRDLYNRLTTMGEHIALTGKNLERAVKAHNAMIGSLERSVLPQARKFQDLQVVGTDKTIDRLGLVETDVRDITAPELLPQSADNDSN